ncbi:hypothetical protein NVP2275O_021 [Vibrio phage 2.275.O._10N.286.54.E11]|nr:hypothetical protein NVP2275O_021 [Vibrio phage 2.275.O._10N.286.54.E11]
MEADYRFLTIHTVIDIGNGTTALTDDEGNITTTANLSRIVDTVMRYSYPFMTSVSSCDVDLSKNKNKAYYRLGSNWSNVCNIFTFKFAVESSTNICPDLKRSLDGIPVVISNDGIDRFILDGNDRNTTIIENFFE